HPINGCGLGLTCFDKKINITYSDYSVLTTLAEMGALGFIFFCGMFISLFIISGKYILKRKDLYSLSLENQKMSGIIFYLMISLFVTNFMTGNNLIQPELWIFLGIVFSVINSINIEMNYKTIEISLFKKPLKNIFNETSTIYIENTKAR
ncbi:MAG: hypothetical protein ABSG15_13060, partial [FCB group bacterium]